MKNTAFVIVALVASSVWTATRQKDPVEALDGVDPVLLVQGKEVSGKKAFAVARDGFEYLFSSAATKAAFEREPARYEIQMHGLCARMGKATGANPSDYLVYDGKIYIFGSDECHRRFQENPKKYLPATPPPIDASPKAITQGRALVERAVAAIGGAAQIDAITTYVETASLTQPRATGPVPLTTKTMWRFPGEFRMERTVTLPDRSMSSATLLTSAGMWYLAQDRAYPAPEAGRPSMQLDYGRQIVPLLHARRQPGFKTAPLGQRTIEGLTVNQVRVVNGAVDVTLGLDPASGRIQAISFADRNDQGEVGEYILLYSDYRPVSGLMLPFSERALFNGVADMSLTRRIDAIQVNVPLAGTLFQPGTVER